jgi:hypothetical protein
MTETIQVSQCTAYEEFISLSKRSQSARLALKWKFALIQPSGKCEFTCSVLRECRCRNAFSFPVLAGHIFY